MKRLFLGNTADPNIFKAMKKEKKKLAVSKDDKDAAKKEKNRTIKLSLYDNVMLYISNTLGCLCFCDKVWPKKKKLQKMFEDGSEKLDSHLDVVKIVKSLKKLKILMENTMMTEDVKKQIKHSEKNIIYLSSEEEKNKDKKGTDKEIEVQQIGSVYPGASGDSYDDNQKLPLNSNKVVDGASMEVLIGN